MDNEGTGGDSVFDIDRIRGLINLMEEHDLTAIDLRQETQRISLQRGASLPAPSAPQPAAPPAPTAAPAEDSNIVTINSPMVGTFYARPNPEADPFVKVGEHINEDTVVCIIEAMKVFNEIPADLSGKVVAVLLDNEVPVEFGSPLFKIDTSQ